MTRIPALFGVLLFLGFSAHTAAQDRSFDERNAIEQTEAASRAEALEQARAIDQGHADDQERVVTSIIPALDYGPSCWSSVTLTNLGDRVETVELEAHRGEGGLVALTGLKNMVLHLKPGEKVSHRLEIAGESGQAWVKVRELVPLPKLYPLIAASGLSQCTVSKQLRNTTRDAFYPMNNPSFSGAVEGIEEHSISLVNTTERAAQASLCYSAGNLYTPLVPLPGRPQLAFVCSQEIQVQIPPYAARLFPVQRDNSTQFSITTQGEAIVLQMLHPLDTGKIYTVDSTVKFGRELTPDR
jgi:hypothetical protein